MRRLVAVVVLASLLSLVLAQRREGTYANTSWSINEHHTLIWGGSPYIPVGLRIDANPEAVESAHAAKVEDVIIDVPANGAGWKDTLATVGENKMRYLLRINSMAPMATGYAVEPQGYRIGGIDKATTIDIPLPGATSAFVVLASRRDGAIDSKARVPIINGRLTYEAKPGPGFEHVLLIYPEMTSADIPDYWEQLDAHRDQLLGSLRRSELGEGLRGIVNPIGRTVELPGRGISFVPTSKFFRMELRNYLEQRYKTVETLTRSWAIAGSDLETFDQIARLVPLWNGDRGVAHYLDPSTNKLYNTDRRVSTAWADITSTVQVAGARRFERLAAAIRTIADVPVVQEWCGWATPYEMEVPGIDGLAMRSSGTSPSLIAESASRATSSVLRWKTRGWLIASDVDLGKGEADKLPLVISDLAGLGSRAFFVRSSDPSVRSIVATEGQRLRADTLLSTLSPVGIFYPENATNPAHPQRLAGNSWWLPSPTDGNRIDLGDMFFAYRQPGQIVLWSTKPGRYRLRMSDPKKGSYRSVDGTLVDPKVGKNWVEVTIGQFPLIISETSEVPVPEVALGETMAQFELMMKEMEKTKGDPLEERLAFKSALAAFDQNPGGSFPMMRLQLYRLGYKLGNYVWQEAERTSVTNFSESGPLPGASNSTALHLDTRIAPGPEGYFAEYTIPVRYKEEQEVWIAARIPEDKREEITVLVGGHPLRITGEPEALYGRGLGWYRLGTVKLAGTSTKLRIVVPSAAMGLALDTVMLSPQPFTPSGVTPPLPIMAGTTR